MGYYVIAEVFEMEIESKKSFNAARGIGSYVIPEYVNEFLFQHVSMPHAALVLT